MFTPESWLLHFIFYAILTDLIRSFPVGEDVILGADLNGHIGVKNDGFEKVHDFQHKPKKLKYNVKNFFLDEKLFCAIWNEWSTIWGILIVNLLSVYVV